MIRLGLVGLGKMGLSHLAIANAHPAAVVVAACDSSSYVTGVLAKHTGLKCYSTFDAMVAGETLDAVIVSTPSRLHAPMVETALQHGLHVFCEKPFVLDVNDGAHLVTLAESKSLVNQVGYHFRFLAAFEEAARIVRSGALGRVHHVRTEAYGPVVLRQKGKTWRSSSAEGGGALYDYACHAIDLTNFIVGRPSGVSGVVLNSIFSHAVEDEIYCSLEFPDGISGQLAVNWSDDSFRKFASKVTVWGSNGRITTDRQECQIYLRERHPGAPELKAGWTQLYTTGLTKGVWFYLRGEEYSAQIDYFLESIGERRLDGKNTFRSALDTDMVVAMLLNATRHAPSPAPELVRDDGQRGRLLSRLRS
jgi:scyllo-inositol 2-dehydrogenase (NADP+)